MVKYIRQFGAPLALTIALMAGACTEKKNDTLARDTALGRDLELANRDTAAQPSLQDVPAAAAPAPATPAPSRTPARTTPRTPAPRPTTRTPAPTPSEPARTASGNTVTGGTAGSEGALGTIAAGTSINLRSSSKVCTNTNKVGDRFTATVAEGVTGSNGVSIPAGATAVLEVTSLKHSNNVNDPIVMGFAVRSVTFGGRSYNVTGDVSYAQIDKVRNSSTGNDAKKVAGGAVIGAIAGQIIGKNTKGTVIGAATGAAAGAAAAAATADYEGCVNEGNRITVKLEAPLTVQAA